MPTPGTLADVPETRLAESVLPNPWIEVLTS